MDKRRQKLTITLSMIWIGSMALIQDPAWIRAALDFVGRSTGHVVDRGGYKGDTTGVTHGQ